MARKKASTAKRLPPNAIGSDTWFKRFQWGKVLGAEEAERETQPINKMQIKMLQELAYLQPEGWQQHLERALALLAQYRYQRCTAEGLADVAASLFQFLGEDSGQHQGYFAEVCTRLDLERIEDGKLPFSNWPLGFVWFALMHQALSALQIPASRYFPEYDL